MTDPWGINPACTRPSTVFIFGTDPSSRQFQFLSFILFVAVLWSWHWRLNRRSLFLKVTIFAHTSDIKITQKQETARKLAHFQNQAARNNKNTSKNMQSQYLLLRTSPLCLQVWYPFFLFVRSSLGFSRLNYSSVIFSYTVLLQVDGPLCFLFLRQRSTRVRLLHKCRNAGVKSFFMTQHSCYG